MDQTHLSLSTRLETVSVNCRTRCSKRALKKPLILWIVSVQLLAHRRGCYLFKMWYCFGAPVIDQSPIVTATQYQNLTPCWVTFIWASIKRDFERPVHLIVFYILKPNSFYSTEADKSACLQYSMCVCNCQEGGLSKTVFLSSAKLLIECSPIFICLHAPALHNTDCVCCQNTCAMLRGSLGMQIYFENAEAGICSMCMGICFLVRLVCTFRVKLTPLWRISPQGLLLQYLTLILPGPNATDYMGVTSDLYWYKGEQKRICVGSKCWRVLCWTLQLRDRLMLQGLLVTLYMVTL